MYFTLKCISAVFCLIALNVSPYSPTVTWYMCAKFEAFPTYRTKGVNVWVFGQVVALHYIQMVWPYGLQRESCSWQMVPV